MIIDYVDTVEAFVCIEIVGGHSVLLHGAPDFSYMLCIDLISKFSFTMF